MKVKYELMSLYAFVLFLMISTNLITSLSLENNEIVLFKRINLATQNENPKHHHSNEKQNTKIINKDESTLIQDGIKYRVLDFFHKTSKSNQNIAAKALGAFVSGIILFICSIHLICWNERRAVKEAQFLDYIRDEKYCEEVNPGKDIEIKDINPNKTYIISGFATVEEEAKIDDLNLNIVTNKGKIAVIKTQFEKFEMKTIVEEDQLGDEGVAIARNIREWNSTFYKDNRFSSKFYYGKTLLNNKYLFPSHHLETQLMLSQKADVADNTYIYRPTQDDISKFEEYFKIENNSNEPLKIFYHNQYIYILRSDVKESHLSKFNPDTYEFSNSDLRMSILFYYIKPDSTFTACGRLLALDNGQIEIAPFTTPIKQPGCSYWCCCCAESSEYYKVDLLYTSRKGREEIVTDLENMNDSCTWILRIVAFLLHFLSYYLILYPLILIIGMIPFLGAIGATILIFFAFLLALMSFLFLIACAWICARPLLAILIFGLIFILMFVGKTSRDHFQQGQENTYNNHNYHDNNYKARAFLK